MKGLNRRLESELRAWFDGPCGFALEVSMGQPMVPGLGVCNRADLHGRIRECQQLANAPQLAARLTPDWTTEPRRV